MKTLSFFLLALTFSNLTWATVEYGYLTTEDGVNATLTLNEGELFEIIEVWGDSRTRNEQGIIENFEPTYYLRGVNPQTNKALLISEFDYNGSPTISLFYGPLELTLTAPGTSQINVLYKLIRIPNPQPVSQ